MAMVFFCMFLFCRVLLRSALLLLLLRLGPVVIAGPGAGVDVAGGDATMISGVGCCFLACLFPEAEDGLVSVSLDWMVKQTLHDCNQTPRLKPLHD